MARRRLLSDEQLAPFWAWASDKRAIVRHYTLSRADLDLIAKKRTASNQLGFAVLMCGMRFPGCVLDVTETPPAVVLAFIADQVGATPAQFATYRQRPTINRQPVRSDRCGSGNLYWRPEFAQCSRCRTLRALSCSDPVKGPKC
jgi:TnpA family transposase